MARKPVGHEIELVPEADRLEGLPHPRETFALFGQDRAEAILLDAFSSGQMHHAWLLTGHSGVGKATLAYRFARFALAALDERDPSGKQLQVSEGSPTARQVAALSHQALLVLRRPYDQKSKRLASSIPVDEVRRLKSFLGLTAGDHAWRVVIVDRADELSPSAANAVLKSLEEPPRRTVFLLIASEPGRLLPTIRSRCRLLNLRPLASGPLRQAVDAALRHAEVGPVADAQWPSIERAAGGSVRRALALATGGGLELYSHVDRLFSDLVNVDWNAAHAFAESLSTASYQQQYETFLDLVLDRLATLLRTRLLAQEPVGPDLRTPSFARSSLSSWAEAWEAVLHDRAVTSEFNLDRKALLIRTIARLQSIAKTQVSA